MPRPPSIRRGNALQLSEWRKRGQQYDPQAHESFVSRMIAVCTPDFFRRVRRLRAGKRVARVRRGAAAVRHDAHRAGPGQPSHVFGAGEISAGPRHVGRAGRRRCGPHRGPWPLGPRNGPPPGPAAPGETSRLGSRSPAHRRQDAGELPVSGPDGDPLSAGKIHSLPPRSARRGRLLLDDALSAKFAGPTTSSTSLRGSASTSG